MKILAVSDEECAALWDHYVPGRLSDYDLIISCGDLKADYLSFLVTMARCPVMYVHGNHDTGYARKWPEGCDCIDGKLVEYNGVRILGLGGCRRYHPGEHQYTDKQMRRRIRKLRFHLWRSKGVDILVTHAPVEGMGDLQDYAHRGFGAFREFLDKYRPKYMLHGHVHLRYQHDIQRCISYEDTTIINVSERYELDVDSEPVSANPRNRIYWKNGEPDTPAMPM